MFNPLALLRRRHAADPDAVKTSGVVASYGPGMASGWPSGWWSSPLLRGRDYAALAGPLHRHPTISVGVAWLRRNCTQGRIVCGIEAAGEYRERPNHAVTALLRKPNGTRSRPVDSWGDLLGGAVADLAIHGNAYWLKVRNAFGQVVELYWLPFNTVIVQPEPDPAKAADRPIARYSYVVGGRSWDYAPEDIVHFRDGSDPDCRYMGLSLLDAQTANAAAIVAGERWTASVLLNGHAGRVMSPKDTDPTVAILVDEGAAAANGRRVERGTTAENAGRIVPIPFPVELQDIGMGPQELALETILDRPESYILAALGLNAMTLGLPSSKDMATYANKGEARREAWENGMIPRQDAIADGIETQLLGDFPGEADSVWWDRTAVEALRENAAEKADRATQIGGLGIATVNELRAMVDLKPIPGEDALPEPAPPPPPANDATPNPDAMEGNADA